MEELLCITGHDCVGELCRYVRFRPEGDTVRFHLLGFTGHQTAWVYQWALLACVDSWAEANVSLSNGGCRLAEMCVIV